MLLTFVAGLALTGDSVAAEDGASATGEPVTTVLYPGWNMVGWIGDDAPVSDLLHSIPAIESVAAWDADTRRYLWARPGGPLPGGLGELTTGMGLWLRLGGSEEVEWAQQPADRKVLIHLRPGRNLVAWTGHGAESVWSLARRLAPSFVLASRWDAAERRQVGYSAGAPPHNIPLSELRAGDALWLEVTDNRYWWQSGAALTSWVFPDSVTEAQRTAVRAGVADVIRFFAERYGIEPPDFTVAVDPEVEVFAGVRGRSILLSEEALSYTLLNVTLAHEYFHILQAHLGQGASLGARASPIWMTEGSATYAGALYERASRRMTADAMTLSWLDVVADADVTLRKLERGALSDAEYAVAYELGALAAQWLTGHAAAAQAGLRHDHLPPEWGSAGSADAYIRYYRALRTADDWTNAFEDVFGITVGAFYERFEAYVGAAIPLATVGVAAADGSGTTRPALRGAVLDADGIPVAGAWVVANTASAWHTGVGPIGAREITLTDADGAFELEGASTPQSWAVILGKGCRVGSEQLAVRRMSKAVFEIRLVARAPCGAS